MSWRRGGSLRSEDGAAVLEVLILMPVLVLALAIIMTVGRLWMVRADVLAVAQQAARAAVTQPDAVSAANSATTAAQSAASDYKLDTSELSVDAIGPFAPGATYKVVVTYHLTMSEIPGLGLLPSSATISASAAQPISRYTNQ
ncbi:MAG TPA: TadE/TadG family type IV pilus assembly protein [Actinomycetota bacterium]|nr:TadE/TadG family type IV pilus assembly protein [Actinomycetota bacterium]